MGKFKDLTGMKFGRLVVLKMLPPEGRHYQWLCRCDCGVEKQVRTDHLLSGRSLSCGCRQREGVKVWARKHGHSPRSGVSGEYSSYHSMLQRCYNPKQKWFKNYGGRGIKVCDRWRESFEAFLEDMGPRPEGLLLERIRNDGDYEPGNCKWATRSEQMRNTRVTRQLTWNGETRVIVAWAEKLGIPAQIIHSRLFAGWTEAEALGTPYVKGDRWAARRKA